jgi:plasmanylethanolamine desaturase
MHTLQILLQALGVILLADFLAGVIHWLEDAYGTEETPVLGPLVIRPNIVHHHYPRFFTKLTWWQSSWDLLLIGALIIGGAAWAGVLTWHVWLFVLLSINANQVHKWSHQTRAENGPVISFFQDIRVLLTPHQHALHHTDPKNTHYCPATNLVNPLLERISFWPKVEAVVKAVTGATHRSDSSNRGEGPAPLWVTVFKRTPTAKVDNLGPKIPYESELDGLPPSRS